MTAARALWSSSTDLNYRGRVARFSQVFGIAPDADDDWFDMLPVADTPLYIDPFLVFQDRAPQWAGSEDEFLRFFRLVAYLLTTAHGPGSSSEWKRAVGLLHFREPQEFALGVAVGHPVGAGTGSYFAGRMAHALVQARTRGMDSIARPEMLPLLCEGIGLDRTSDIVANILKARFIVYTQDVARRHGIRTELIKVRNAAWTPNGWQTRTARLPRNPETGSAILLAPQRFLKDISPVRPEDLFDWATTRHADELRSSLNQLIGNKLARRERLTARDRERGGRDFASRYPERALEFVQDTRSDPESYDVERDPKLLVRWLEVGRQAALAAEPVDVPIDGSADVPQFVDVLIHRLKNVIERGGIWKAFWDQFGHERPTQIWQAICATYITVLCERAGAEISRPFDVGREPVEIRTRNGQTRPICIYIKSVANGQFFRRGGSATPRDAREVVAVVGLAIKPVPAEGSLRETAFRLTCEQLAQGDHTTIRPTIIDAQPRGWV